MGRTALRARRRRRGIVGGARVGRLVGVRPGGNIWVDGSLEAKPRKARHFYAVIAAGIVLGVIADLVRLDAVRALFWSAVVDGFVAIPLLAGVLFTANRRDLMGRWINGRTSQVWMVLTIALMTFAAIGTVITSH